KGLIGEFRVYSFGASGAPLSQYLVWARHAVRDYGATALVINVTARDFDESLASDKQTEGFASYVRDASGELHLQLFERRMSSDGSITSRSALASYVVLNLGALECVRELWARITNSTSARDTGKLATEPGPQRATDSLAAIEAFFRDLPE